MADEQQPRRPRGTASASATDATTTPAADTTEATTTPAPVPPSLRTALVALVDDERLGDAVIAAIIAAINDAIVGGTFAGADQHDARFVLTPVTASASVAAPGERRRFPVDADVLNGGALVTAGGTVAVTEDAFLQLRAGLSIAGDLRWDDGAALD